MERRAAHLDVAGVIARGGTRCQGLAHGGTAVDDLQAAFQAGEIGLAAHHRGVENQDFRRVLADRHRGDGIGDVDDTPSGIEARQFKSVAEDLAGVGGDGLFSLRQRRALATEEVADDLHGVVRVLAQMQRVAGKVADQVGQVGEVV